MLGQLAERHVGRVRQLVGYCSAHQLIQAGGGRGISVESSYLGPAW